MAAAAQDFLNSLEPEQQKKAAYPFEAEERFNWHYIPLERHGLPIREMRPDQRVLAYGLLSTGLESHRLPQGRPDHEPGAGPLGVGEPCPEA